MLVPLAVTHFAVVVAWLQRADLRRQLDCALHPLFAGGATWHGGCDAAAAQHLTLGARARARRRCWRAHPREIERGGDVHGRSGTIGNELGPSRSWCLLLWSRAIGPRQTTQGGARFIAGDTLLLVCYSTFESCITITDKIFMGVKYCRCI